MAILFMDGADHYDTNTEMSLKWNNSTGDWDPNTAAVRSGVRGIRKTSGASPSLRRTLAGNYSTLYVGFALRRPTVTSGDEIFCRFLDAGTEQMSVRMVTNTGILYVSRNGTTVATSSFGIVINVWYYIEFMATIHNTTGAYELRVNGTNIASASGVNTRGSANNFANQLGFGGASNVGITDIDDIYLCDDSGGAPTNTFLGDCKVDTLFPNANGNLSQFTGSDSNSVDNYQLVDENTLDIADYVQSTANDQVDTYGFTDLSITSGTVYGVQIVASALKTDAGAKSVALVTRRGGSDYASADQALSTSQQMHMQIREQDPSTATGWSVSAINAAEFGVKARA